ncbi:two-component regulator propeller domain-containing protein [Candidatus Latescibacterota bacterium]
MENGLPTYALTSMFIDYDNNLWIGTDKNGIISYDGTSWTLYDSYKPKVVSIASDDDKMIWFAGNQGMLFSFDGINWSSNQVVSKSSFLFTFAIDNGGIFWIATNQGLYRIENDNIDIYTEKDGIKSSNKSKIFIHENDVWHIGVNGISKFKGSMFVNHTGPAANSIDCIAIDHNYIKWFGHRTKNITRYDDSTWLMYSHNNIDAIGEHIAVDSNNNIWFSAEFGYVLSYDGTTLHDYHIWGEYDRDASSEDAWTCPVYAHSIAPDKEGNVWIYANGTCDYSVYGSISFFDLYKEMSIKYYTDCAHNLAVDSKNQLWMSRRISVSHMPEIIQLSTEKTYLTENIILTDIPTEYIFRIKFDSNDTIWITSKSGTSYYDGSSWTSYNTDNSSLPSNNVLSLEFDSNNTKWIGTDAGTVRFDGETWTVFNTQNSGLCNDTVNAIAVEENNTIWFGTDNGISRYTGEVIEPSAVDNATPQPLPLIQTYPNPFNPTTAVEFTLPQSGQVTVTVYNMAGQAVRELAGDFMTAGNHRLVWDGRDSSGNNVSAGVYFARLKAGVVDATAKMVLVK